MDRVRQQQEIAQEVPDSKVLRQSVFAQEVVRRGLSKAEAIEAARFFPKSVVQQCRMLRPVK